MLFHVAPAPATVGQIIKPGGWGRQTRGFRAGGSAITSDSIAHILMWEVALETARQAAYGSLPSRLDCVFTFEEKVDAVWFRDTFRSGNLIVGCEPAEPCACYRGDFGLLIGSEAPLVDHMADVANRYWATKPSIRTEVLIAGAIRVTEVFT